MSRILKAPYINIDKNVVIDNTFNVEQNIEQNIEIENDTTNQDLTIENEQSITEEENKYLEQLKEDILAQANEEANRIIENASQEAEIKAEDEPVTVVGIMPFLSEGDSAVFYGEYTFHASYGRQFRAEGFERKTPQNAAAILKYL